MPSKPTRRRPPAKDRWRTARRQRDKDQRRRSGAIVRRLRTIPGVEVVADGSDGANVVFAPSVLRFVARVMKPRSCRKLSPTHAAALARGRELRKPPSGGASQSAGGPIGGKPAVDTPEADRPFSGPDFSSRKEVI